MKVLVTGGCGFVGRHFVHRFLATDDNEVLAVDNLSTGIPVEKWMFPPRYIERLTFRPSDCREMFRRNTIKPEAFDLVVHCAANVGGKLNMENDPLAVATNLAIDSEMFNWVVRGKHPLPHVIYFSSAAVYPAELQTREKNCALAEPLVTLSNDRFSLPEGSYGFAKLAGEYLAKIAREKYGLKVAVYRPFGGYGADQDETYPFPAIIRRAFNGEDPVLVWGSGDQRRDFIHIADVVDCVLQTYRRGETLNIGTGVGTSFYELADLVREVTGLKFNIRNDPSKPEGVFARVADTYQMRQLSRPRIPLREGIAKAVKALDKQVAKA